jgi:acetyltransferase-like isoleucine patch superfamily enzyme
MADSRETADRQEADLLHLPKQIARTALFIARRFIVFVVNMLAVPPDATAIQTLRCWIMRLIGFKVGNRSQLSEGLYVYNGRNFRAGPGCRIGSFCRIWDFTEIIIGDNLLASHGLTLISGTHYLDIDRTSRPGPIRIGDNVWIGINVTIVGPAHVGDNVIIGANSLVIHDLESNGVYAGSPAKLIRKMDANIKQETSTSCREDGLDAKSGP